MTRNMKKIEKKECTSCGIHYFKGKDDPLDFVFCPECKKEFYEEAEE